MKSIKLVHDHELHKTCYSELCTKFYCLYFLAILLQMTCSQEHKSGDRDQVIFYYVDEIYKVFSAKFYNTKFDCVGIRKRRLDKFVIVTSLKISSLLLRQRASSRIRSLEKVDTGYIVHTELRPIQAQITWWKDQRTAHLHEPYEAKQRRAVEKPKY